MVFGGREVFEIFAAIIERVQILVVDFVVGRRFHYLDMQAESDCPAALNVSSHNVETMRGFNEPPVMAASPHENVMVNQRKVASADR